MLDVSNIADGKTCIIRCNVIWVMNMVGNVFDGAKGAVNGIMVHGAASFPVFIIVQIEVHTL